MAFSLVPFGIVALSAGSYSVLLRTVRRQRPPHSSTAARAQIKAISAGHAALMALMAAVVLRQSRWTTSAPDKAPKPIEDSQPHLDDTANPIIQGSSRLANALVAWETGYLLYDLGALVQASRGAPIARSFAAHHVLLVAALLYLQLYIARARERGMWVVTALLLMNATNPLLHLRWWLGQQGKGKGKGPSASLDALFAAWFGAWRFGIVAWILTRYGAYHGLGPLEAFRRLRRPCQGGMATLVSLNAFWWCFLVGNLIVRSRRKIQQKVYVR